MKLRKFVMNEYLNQMIWINLLMFGFLFGNWLIHATSPFVVPGLFVMLMFEVYVFLNLLATKYLLKKLAPIQYIKHEELTVGIAIILVYIFRVFYAMIVMAVFGTSVVK